MKKLAPALLATGLLTGLSYTGAPAAHAAIAPDSFVIIVEDKEITFDPAPIVIQDRAFVPLRSLANSLGADVQYDSKTDTATITKDSLVLTLNFATGEVKKNGVAMTVDPAPRFVNDRTMVPIRFISEVFGNEVTYEGATQTIQVLPTHKTLEQRQKMKSIMLHSQEVMNAKNSYSVEALMQMKATQNGSIMALDGTLNVSFTKNPLMMHEKGTLSVGMTGAPTEKAEFDMYLSKDAMYLLNPSTKKWEKTTTIGNDPLTELTNMLSLSTYTAQDEAELTALLPYATLSEDKTAYHLIYSLDSKGMEKLLASQSDNPLKLNGEEVSFKLTVDIDKATYQQLGTSMQLELSEGSTHVTAQLTGTVKDIDKVPPIVIPDEVLKSVSSTSKQ